MRWLARLLSGKRSGAKPRALAEASPEAPSEAPSVQEAPKTVPPVPPAAEPAPRAAEDPSERPEAARRVSASLRHDAARSSGVLLKRPPRAYEDRIRPVAFRTDPIPVVTVPKRLFKNETTPCLPWEADASGRVVLGGDGALREAERRVQAKFSRMVPGPDEGAPLTDAEVCWSDEEEAAEAAGTVKPVRSGQLLFDFAEADPGPAPAPKAVRSGR